MVDRCCVPVEGAIKGGYTGLLVTHAFLWREQLKEGTICTFA